MFQLFLLIILVFQDKGCEEKPCKNNQVYKWPNFAKLEKQINANYYVLGNAIAMPRTFHLDSSLILYQQSAKKSAKAKGK
jgi:hypothetical protein